MSGMGTAEPRQEYGTPVAFMDWVNERFGRRELDVCALEWNRKCARYYGPPGYHPGESEAWLGEDGLAQPWYGRVWCNPGFDDVGPWLVKAAHEARVNNAHVLVLTHAGFAEWFCHAWHQCAGLYPIHPRIDFEPAEGVSTSGSNPRDSFLWEFRRDVLRGDAMFSPLAWPKPRRQRKSGKR